MATKYRHVLPSNNHFAAFILRAEPYARVIPLIDRVLVSRGEGEEFHDEIVGTVIWDRTYSIADEIDNKNVKFFGYVDPNWLKATTGQDLPTYEESIRAYGRQWQSRSTPVVVPEHIEKLFSDAEYDEEEETTPPPPRKRKR